MLTYCFPYASPRISERTVNCPLFVSEETGGNSGGMDPSQWPIFKTSGKGTLPTEIVLCLKGKPTAIYADDSGELSTQDAPCFEEGN